MRVISESKKPSRKITEFTGLQDILDYVGMAENKAKHEYGQAIRGAAGFTGTQDWEEAEKLAKSGWTVGTSAMLGKVSQVSSRVADYATTYRFDVTGDMFDVGLVVTGEPECWLHPEPEPSKRIISICVNISASCTISTKQIENMGAAVIALIDKLQEDPQNIVELTLAEGADNAEGDFKNVIHYIKIGMSPIPLNDVAFMLAHPSMLRRFMFAVMEKENNYGYMGNYGRPDEAPDMMDYEVYLGRSYSSDGMPVFDTVEGAAKWVDSVLTRLNGVEG